MAIEYTASRSKAQYTRRIGDNGFLGADFSTAPIFASERRFRDLKNVWKDYKSGSGVGIETVPGYRNVPFAETGTGKINGMCVFTVAEPSEAVEQWNYEHRNDEGFVPVDTRGTWVLIHKGSELLCVKKDEIDSGATIGDRNKTIFFQSDSGSTALLPDSPSVMIPTNDHVNLFTHRLDEGEFEPFVFKIFPTTAAFYSISKTDADSESEDDPQPYPFFGIEYRDFLTTTEITTPEQVAQIRPYIPTTFIDGEPYEQKNMLCVRSREMFHVTSEVMEDVSDPPIGVTCVLHEKVVANNGSDFTNINSFVLDGIDILESGLLNNGLYIDESEGHVVSVKYVFPQDQDHEEGEVHTVVIEYDSDETTFTSYKSYEDFKDRTTFNEGNPGYSGTAFDAIAGCTICATFDERIFLAGNPNLPNTVIYSQRDLTGYNNPEYFGVLNYNNLGTSNAPIKAMIPSATSLCVLKDDSATDPTMYFLTGMTTEYDLIPRVYTVESGLPGIGCKGAACNFLDDIVFMSRNGVIGIDKQAVNLERTLGDRSALINGKLLQEDVTQAVFAEAEGYLWCLFKDNGHVYLADSRTYTQGAGYEWYYIERVGSWSGDADLLVYSNDKAGMTYTYNNKTYNVVLCTNPGEQYTGETETIIDDESPEYGIILVPTGTENEYYQVEKTGEKVGGTFHPATCMVAFDDRILFGTDNGDLLTFNNDKRGLRAESEDSDVPNRYPFLLRPEWYSFCGHRIESFIETEDDDAGIANATKDTVKRSCVVDMKAMLGSKYRITFYTDRDGWRDDLSATGSTPDASNVNESAFNFKGDDHVLAQVRERSRKWVHKRYRVESDGFCSPFGLYRITYNYTINGRVK